MGGPWNITKSKGGPGGGEDGREIELQKALTHVQWRYVGSPTWTNLIALSEITGPQGPQGSQGIQGATGPSIELQKTSTHVQWRVTGGAWADLIALSEITGPTGEPGSPGAGSSISNPHVIYVRSDGNDGTAEIGNPSKPFLTAQAAYDAGVTAAADFILNLGVGAFWFSDSAGTNGYFKGAVGQGAALTFADSLTRLSINTIPGTVDNTNGTAAGDILGFFSRLGVMLTAIGGSVTINDEVGGYSGGSGGSVTVWGDATFFIDATGGSCTASYGENFTGGTAGVVDVRGGIIDELYCENGEGVAGGSPIPASVSGAVTLICVNAASAMFGLASTSDVTAGCSALPVAVTPVTDKGGNSTW